MTWSITDQVRRRGRPRGPGPELTPPRISNARSPNRADEALDALTHAARDTTPACTGDARFTAERHETPPTDLIAMRGICRTCPLHDLCNTYATTARPAAGFWAGAHYGKEGSS
ncbi:hypothetical protein AB1K56_02710 [Microbacterium sp. BWR-S6Y]|uniref:hypothetical protein n=1 Tax=Microbacterium sp. BWR-S6Y TaxID=3232073 RepID=UPI00352873BD